MTLAISDGGDGISFDQSDWAEAKVELRDGRQIWLGDLPQLGTWGALDDAAPFFSFQYDGKPSSDCSGRLAPRVRPAPARRHAHRTPADLYRPRPPDWWRARFGIQYDDFPTVEWTLYFKNAGSAPTPILSEIKALDLGLERDDAPEFLLHHHRGSESGIEDYRPLETELKAGADTPILASNGRTHRGRHALL